MKKVLLCAAFIAASFTSIAQIGIGTTTPVSSAALEIFSSSKGLLLPRLDKANRDIMLDPARGLIIFCTDCSGGTGEISFFNGTTWGALSDTPAGLPSTKVKADEFGGTFTFMSHNLGANTTLDPNTPNEGLNGDYYQWGRNAPAATLDVVIGKWGDQGGDGIPGSWLPDVKGPKDPCPEGYRVPSKEEWLAVLAMNNANVSGTWDEDLELFSSTLNLSSDEYPDVLYLPAAGVMESGNLKNLNVKGRYWSSTADETDGERSYRLHFRNYPDRDPKKQLKIIANKTTVNSKGFPVRCIAE